MRGRSTPPVAQGTVAGARCCAGGRASPARSREPRLRSGGAFADTAPENEMAAECCGRLEHARAESARDGGGTRDSCRTTRAPGCSRRRRQPVHELRLPAGPRRPPRPGLDRIGRRRLRHSPRASSTPFKTELIAHRIWRTTTQLNSRLSSGPTRSTPTACTIPSGTSRPPSSRRWARAVRSISLS